jgi:hypothetical protein
MKHKPFIPLCLALLATGLHAQSQDPAAPIPAPERKSVAVQAARPISTPATDQEIKVNSKKAAQYTAIDPFRLVGQNQMARAVRDGKVGYINQNYREKNPANTTPSAPSSSYPTTSTPPSSAQARKATSTPTVPKWSAAATTASEPSSASGTP